MDGHDPKCATFRALPVSDPLQLITEKIQEQSALADA
jgi:hypothetical protein